MLRASLAVRRPAGQLQSVVRRLPDRLRSAVQLQPVPDGVVLDVRPAATCCQAAPTRCASHCAPCSSACGGSACASPCGSACATGACGQSSGGSYAAPAGDRSAAGRLRKLLSRRKNPAPKRLRRPQPEAADSRAEASPTAGCGWVFVCADERADAGQITRRTRPDGLRSGGVVGRGRQRAVRRFGPLWDAGAGIRIGLIPQAPGARRGLERRLSRAGMMMSSPTRETSISAAINQPKRDVGVKRLKQSASMPRLLTTVDSINGLPVCASAAQDASTG